MELKPTPQKLFADSTPATGPGNYLRFQLSPTSAIALSARVKRAGKEFVGEQRELYLVEEQPGEESPYERLLGDAMAGDGALFTREDAVEAAWAVVDPVLKKHHRTRPYKRHSWGPKRPTRLSPLTAVGTTPHERYTDDREIAWSRGNPARHTVVPAKIRKRGLMNKILLPLDFSNASLRVIHQAAFLARIFIPRSYCCMWWRH